MEALSNLLNILYITNETKYNTVYELNEQEETNDNSEIEYHNFIIKNNVGIKSKIDKLNDYKFLAFDLYKKANGCDLSLIECVNTLNYLLNRKEIINSIEHINSLSSNNFKEIIESLFSRIIIIHLDKYNESNDINYKHVTNVKLCEYAIHYYNIFTNTIFRKSFDNFYKSLAYRAYYLSINTGCIISWLTFAKLIPDMVNDDCYPKINKTTIFYKNKPMVINIEYIKKLKIFEKEIELYYKLIL